jgi:phage tail sheath protein FI
MPNYLTPGVYVEEIPSQSKPIEGVGTSVAAFVGLAPGGPVNVPQRIANWSQFERTFSDPDVAHPTPFMEGAYLAHAVYGFFHNGGALCWVVRVGGDETPPKASLRSGEMVALASGEKEHPAAFDIEAKDNAPEPITAELAEEPPKRGQNGNGGEKTYRLTIKAGRLTEAPYEGLLLKDLAKTVTEKSKFVTVTETDAGSIEKLLPGTYRLNVPSVVPSALTQDQVEGDAAEREGLEGVTAVEEVTMVCVPDLMAMMNDSNGNVADKEKILRALQSKVVEGCENAGQRMAILDPPPDRKPDEVLDWVLTSNLDSKFATMYWPWVEVMDPITKRPIQVPPCGHVAGIWCRTDSTRGVHKAPANEVVLGANDLAYQLTGAEQDSLNRAGINCIRAFPGRGIRVWGARTLSSDPEWRYINVRRLFNFVSESIMQGTQWAVFEPNDERLWMSLKISAANFLTRIWRSGALFGATPDQAFFVKCDEETNPPDMVEAGQVTVEVGIAPVKPAEFVVFRIRQFQVQAGAE